MTHADVERLLQTEGTELLRRLFQGHLDARGVGETTAPVQKGVLTSEQVQGLLPVLERQ
jgi:hypothetical protein